MSNSQKLSKELINIYVALFNEFGDQHWWPAKTSLEVIVGAVLAQFISWTNASKAVNNLADSNMLDVYSLYNADVEEIKDKIQPAGYYNKKAVVLKSMMDYIVDKYQGNLKTMFSQDISVLRIELLAIKGIGPETADSILLYAASKPIFVIDAYTTRMMQRMGYIDTTYKYHDIQRIFMDNLDKNIKLYNQYHALIVKFGSTVCLKSKPKCEVCPLRTMCKKIFAESNRK